MSAALAQVNLGTLKGLGPLGNLIPGAEAADSFVKFNTILSTTLALFTVSGGVWFIFQILIGSFQWLSSGGEKQGVENARKRITNAILGLFIVVASYALISLVGLVFGINILSPIQSLFGIFAPSAGSVPAASHGGVMPGVTPPH